MVQTFSLPIATPCSLTPCSRPQSHSGREPSTACGAGVGEGEVLRATVPAAGRRAEALDDLRLVRRAVGVLGEERAGRADDAERVAHGDQTCPELGGEVGAR